MNRRFETAQSNGVVIERASITCNNILDHLMNGPVIILTNARLLNCDVCKFNKISTELRKCIPLPVPYQGHYVVLCGYDLAARKVYYRNPSFVDSEFRLLILIIVGHLFCVFVLAGVCIMSVDTLEEARKSYGTDEDVIFVYT